MSITFGPTPCLSMVARCSATGHGERPSWLTTTVVTPCETTFGAALRWIESLRMVLPPRPLPSSACEWMSMNPGDT